MASGEGRRHRSWPWLLIAVAVVLGVVYANRESDRSAPDVEPLRPVGGRFAGVSVIGDKLDDGGYAALIAKAFNAMTPENELKWEIVHPKRGTYDFGRADRVVKFGDVRRMRVRGHTLVWHLQNPAWLEQGRYSREDAIEVMRRHIHTVMRRYRNRIAEWDVVNEAVTDDGKLRDSVWLRTIGPEYIALAFRFAREADPDAKLYYNDYGAEGAGPKSDGVFALLSKLKREGVPVDGVGLQTHVTTAPIPRFEANLVRFAHLGLDIVLSEVDVRLKRTETADATALERQAAAYRRIARGCVRQPRCRGIVVWGVDDSDSWIPDVAFGGYGAPLLFDGDLKPKPAYDAFRRALAGE